MSEWILNDEEIEQWLKERLGSGNIFEAFNRDFCKDLAKAQHQADVEWLEKHLEHRFIEHPNIRRYELSEEDWERFIGEE